MPTHRLNEDQGSDQLLLQEYERFLTGKAEGTIEAYLRTVRQMMDWIDLDPLSWVCVIFRAKLKQTHKSGGTSIRITGS